MNGRTKRKILLYKNRSAIYLQNFIFGVEDSLVSTVGVISGVAAGGGSFSMIILAGVVLIFVEAFSMGVGSFMSEHIAEEFIEQKEASQKISISAGLIMFSSYFLAGFIPISSYLIFDFNSAFLFSIIFSLIALFILGFIGAEFARTKKLKHGFEMMFVGGIAIAIGITVGKFVHLIF